MGDAFLNKTSTSTGTGTPTATVPILQSLQSINGEFGNNTSTTYSLLMTGTGGPGTNRFAFVYFPHGDGTNRFVLSPFTVNKTTGAITKQSDLVVWHNTTVTTSRASTVGFTTIEGGGKVTYAGHVVPPGNSGNTYGYGYASLTDNNTLQQSGFQADSSGYIPNGHYVQLGFNSDYRGMQSFFGAVSNQTRHLNWSSSTGAPSIGGLTSNTNTSTNYGISIFGQFGLIPTSSTPVSLWLYQNSSGVLQMRAYNTSGTSYDHNVSTVGGFTLASQGLSFHLQDGSVVIFPSGGGAYRLTSYNGTLQPLSSGSPWSLPRTYFRSQTITSIGNDEFICTVQSNNFNPPLLIKFKIDPVLGFIRLGSVVLPLTALEAGYTSNSVLKAIRNNSNVYDKLLVGISTTGSQSAMVFAMPTFT